MMRTNDIRLIFIVFVFFSSSYLHSVMLTTKIFLSASSSRPLISQCFFFVSFFFGSQLRERTIGSFSFQIFKYRVKNIASIFAVHINFLYIKNWNLQAFYGVQMMSLKIAIRSSIDSLRWTKKFISSPIIAQKLVKN